MQGDRRPKYAVGKLHLRQKCVLACRCWPDILVCRLGCKFFDSPMLACVDPGLGSTHEHSLGWPGLEVRTAMKRLLLTQSTALPTSTAGYSASVEPLPGLASGLSPSGGRITQTLTALSSWPQLLHMT